MPRAETDDRCGEGGRAGGQQQALSLLVGDLVLVDAVLEHVVRRPAEQNGRVHHLQSMVAIPR